MSPYGFGDATLKVSDLDVAYRRRINAVWPGAFQARLRDFHGDCTPVKIPQPGWGPKRIKRRQLMRTYKLCPPMTNGRWLAAWGLMVVIGTCGNMFARGNSPRADIDRSTLAEAVYPPEERHDAILLENMDRFYSPCEAWRVIKVKWPFQRGWPASKKDLQSRTILGYIQCAGGDFQVTRGPEGVLATPLADPGESDWVWTGYRLNLFTAIPADLTGMELVILFFQADAGVTPSGGEEWSLYFGVPCHPDCPDPPPCGDCIEWPPCYMEP